MSDRWTTYRELLRDLFVSVLGEPRELVMDGEVHIEGQCCGDDSISGDVCTSTGAARIGPNGYCGGRIHEQPVYGAIMRSCESCNAADWWPAGSHRRTAHGFCDGEVLW